MNNHFSGRSPGEALKALRNQLYKEGYTVETETWQGTEKPPQMLEILHAGAVCNMENTYEKASDSVRATQPWAGIHFQERVGGQPLNPPPSHTMWLKDTDSYLSKNAAFSHSYPERLWCDRNKAGIRFNQGNLSDAVKLLKKEPMTRQCYVPMWFPEDLQAALLNERVPCSFGWHFMNRGGQLHCSYHMRSCDVVRHLHNDLFFANALAIWINDEAGLGLEMGYLNFSASSLHCFSNDRYALKQLTEN